MSEEKGKKNVAFENAWDLYTDELYGDMFREYLPGLTKLFSSGNKLQAEQKFNAEMRAAMDGLSMYGSEMAWAADHELPDVKMLDLFERKYADKDDKDGTFVLDDDNARNTRSMTDEKVVRLRDLANQYFSANPEEYSDATGYYKKVQDFKDEGYDDGLSEIYAIPSRKFKSFNKALDEKAGMSFTGKDNKKHSVSQDFHERGSSPKDKYALAKITGGALTEQFDEETNLNNLEQYAKDMGFVNSDALLDYLALSYDRSNRLREQEDDGLATKVAKNIAMPWVNEKWDEGVPASNTDIAHDVILGGLEVAPQGKAAGMLGKIVMKAAPKSKLMLNAGRTATSPWVKYTATKATLPFETAYLDNAMRGENNGIDLYDVAKQTIGNSSLDIAATAGIRRLLHLPMFSKLPVNAKEGLFLESNKDIVKRLEKKAYDMAFENEAAKAARNIMLKSGPASRTDFKLMYKRLAGNKDFKEKFPLADEQLNRVFNEAWNIAQYANARKIDRSPYSLRTALKNFDSYKRTNDFKNALHAAALATAGFKDEDLLGKVRTNTLGYLEKDKADYAKAANLELLYDDYSKERRGLQNIAKFLKYDLKPELIRVGENTASARRIYAPIYGSVFNGLGMKQYDKENK